MPIRIQRRRIKGWKMPKDTVYVGRPTKWGNPFKEGNRNPYGTITADLRHSFVLYRAFAPLNARLVAEARAELRGSNLACWCPLDQDCHADILLELANQEQ